MKVSAFVAAETKAIWNLGEGEVGGGSWKDAEKAERKAQLSVMPR